MRTGVRLASKKNAQLRAKSIVGAGILPSFRWASLISIVVLASCTVLPGDATLGEDPVDLGDGTMLIIDAYRNSQPDIAGWDIVIRRTKERGLYPPIWSNGLLRSIDDPKGSQATAQISVGQNEILVQIAWLRRAFRLELSSGKIIEKMTEDEVNAGPKLGKVYTRRIHSYGPQSASTPKDSQRESPSH